MVATGKVHSIRDFINIVCDFLEINIIWQGDGVDSTGLDETGRIIVKVDPAFYRPTNESLKAGDISKAKKILDWKPKVDLEKLVEMMVEVDLKELNLKK